MDYITITIAVVSFVLGAISVFFLAPKSKEEIESESKELGSVEELKQELKRLKELLTISETKTIEAERRSEILTSDKNGNSSVNQNDSFKLQEQITQLTDEIEGLEIEISDLEKRNKRGEEKVYALEEKVYNIEKEKNILFETNQKNIEKIIESDVKASESERRIVTLNDEVNKISNKNQSLLEIQKQNNEEISQLKDEIEELEDEISDLEKRNKRVKEEVYVLDEKIYTIEKEKNNLSDTIDKKKLEIEKVEMENKRQKESLDFVSDILKANNTVNENFLEVYDKTTKIYSYIRNDLQNSLSNFEYKFITDEFLYDCWNWRNQEIKTWIKNKRVVAIVGEFSAGKTTIVNRILKQDDPNAIELPVDSKETTAIPTYISKGLDFSCQFYSPSGDLKIISAESFQKVTKSVIDDINISSLVKYFVLSYNNENLENISILDTPGFGSNSDEIISKTTEVVKEADALFWVVDANTGDINSSSLNVIKDNLQQVPLYIIINKSDTKSKADLEVLKEKIDETLNKNNISFEQVIFFSQKHEIDKLMKIINSISSKKSSEVITQTYQQIREILERSKSEKLKLNKEVSTLDHNVGCSKIELKKVIEDIGHSLNDMKRVVSLEKHIFGKPYFKIRKSDFDTFKSGFKKIEKSENTLPLKIENLFSDIGSHDTKRAERYTLKENYKNLIESEKTFLELVKDYNPKLLN